MASISEINDVYRPNRSDVPTAFALALSGLDPATPIGLKDLAGFQEKSENINKIALKMTPLAG